MWTSCHDLDEVGACLCLPRWQRLAAEGAKTCSKCKKAQEGLRLGSVDWWDKGGIQSGKDGDDTLNSCIVTSESTEHSLISKTGDRYPATRSSTLGTVSFGGDQHGHRVEDEM